MLQYPPLVFRKKLFLFRLALLVFVEWIAVSFGEAATPVVISEFMAAGQYVISDEDGDYSDWLELHNTSASAVDLAGWHLTDKADEPEKWALPSVTLPPNGFLLVFADGKNRAVPGARLHANFSLSGNGEYLALTGPSGAVAFKFDPYPVQMPDVSFDEAGHFLGNPTPGAANDATTLAIAAAPSFSEAHGLKSRAFALTLTTTTNGGHVRFTIDGSEPTETAGATYTAPIPIRKTTVVRAVAYSDLMKASPVVTRTYIFPADVATQAADGKAPPRWPLRWTGQKTDYGMDPRITGTSPYREQLQRTLKLLPSISIVMPLDGLFDEERGIYNHPQEHGKEWERATSIELIESDGTPGFQVNGGIRIRGGASRDTSNPKHSLRLFFRRDYGTPQLEYPMFGAEGTPVCDKFDLRCDQISSWHWAGEKKDDFIRDQWGRDTQIAMGQPGDRGDFFHLYINGLYWGLYNTQERHDASFAAHYFGGNEGDYDVVKYDNTFGGTNDADGTIASWRRLHDAAYADFTTAAKYQRVQGNNPDGSRNPAYERLVDVDNLIDYMLIGDYCAASDNPPSGGVQNNWGAIKSRQGDFGFRFFIHDWELSMFDAQADNVVGEQPVDNPLGDFNGGKLDYTMSNVWHIWQALRFNADFRLRVADRVQKHFFGDGVLTPAKAAARFQARMDEINLAVVGESARWGDAFFTNNDTGGPIGPFLTLNPRNGEPAAKNLDFVPRPNGAPHLLTRQDWLNATRVQFIQNYFPIRTAIVLQQLKDGGLYPAIDSPTITPASGNIAAAQLITLANPNATGAIYFTLDGSDPRLLGGGIAASAKLYAQPVLLGPLKRIKARIKDGETWSALAEARYENAQDFSKLRITEISYHNAAVGAVAGDEYDFIELKNAGTTALDMSGLLFDQGVTFAFPTGTTLTPGAFFVIGKNAPRFSEAHPGKTLDGIFTGKLSDNGEDLVLSAGSGVPLISLHYRTDEGWPAAANGFGFTLVRADKGSPDNPKNWRASTNIGGSPGGDDPEPPAIPRVVVNRLDANPATGSDSVEVKNLGDVTADISGWWFTDDPAVPQKFRILSALPIPAGGVRSLPTAALDFPKTGGGVWLFSANAVGDLTGYAHGFSYGAVETGSVLERIVNSVGDEKFVLTGNPNPRINEIHFHPAIGGDEFVEIRREADPNRGPLSLADWRLNGLSFTFPAEASLAPGGLALVVTIDPAAFRTKYNVPAEVPIYGPTTGNLQDEGEEVALQKPLTFPGIAGTFYETIGSVRYNDKSPWPYETNGFGASLQRPSGTSFADDPASWLAAAPTPGISNTVNAAPAVTLTSPVAGADITPPEKVHFTVNATDDDGTIAKVEFLSDSVVIGEKTSAPFAFDWSGAETGLHDLTARATDDSGNVTESDPVTVTIGNPQPGAGRGMLGEYFGNRELTGNAVARTDAAIDFQWTDIDPAPRIPRTGFSVRWTGKFLARVNGETTFDLRVAGGVRLYVNDALLIDEWDNEQPQDFFANFTAIAGETASLRLEYRDGDGFASIQFLYNEPGRFDSKTLPTDQLYLPTQDPTAFAISSPPTLPPATAGVPYRYQFKTVHGVSPIAFQQVQFSNIIWPGYTPGLPQGMTLSPTGLLSGTPGSAATYGIALFARDASGNTAPSAGPAALPPDQVVAAQQTEFFKITVLPAGPRVLPAVTLTSPAQSAKLIGDTVKLTGSASSERRIRRVDYALDGGPWRPLTLVGPAPATIEDTYRGPLAVTFAATLDNLRGLSAGANTILVRAIDADGFASRSVSRQINVRQFAPLTVGIEGAGNVSPEFLGTTRREVGVLYTISARPARGQIFSGWKQDGFIISSDRTLSFSMFKGLKITAVFIPNPYPALAGRYVAALGGDQERSDARGLIGMQLGGNGSFSGRLRLGGKSFPFSGSFDPSGFYYVQLEGGGIIFDARRAGLLPRPGFQNLSLSIGVNFETSAITATVSYFSELDSFTVESVLARSSWRPSAGSACPIAGRWTITIPPPIATVGGNPLPTNRGTATATISANGRVVIVGKLGDGTSFTTTSVVDDQLALPLHISLYNHVGSMSGVLRPTLVRPLRPTGDFFWSRPADETSASFPLGFSVHLNVEMFDARMPPNPR